jgi:predicted pyridoxine 5'-phosphate oxidase superfamily flavin-nucleotide-binding protein
MAKMPKQVMEKFNASEAIKLLATIDENGIPNVAYITSLMAADEETLIYADSAGVKTKRNLLHNPQVAAIVVLKEKIIAYQVKGTFQGFETSGKYYEMLSALPAYRYNAYFGVRAAGVIKVEEVYSSSPPLPGRRIVPPEPYLQIQD